MCEMCRNSKSFDCGTCNLTEDECASGIVVATPSASNNSRYVTALDVYEECMESQDGIILLASFVDWCKQRLNPPKAADCT